MCSTNPIAIIIWASSGIAIWFPGNSIKRFSRIGKLWAPSSGGRTFELRKSSLQSNNELAGFQWRAGRRTLVLAQSIVRLFAWNNRRESTARETQTIVRTRFVNWSFQFRTCVIHIRLVAAICRKAWLLIGNVHTNVLIDRLKRLSSSYLLERDLGGPLSAGRQFGSQACLKTESS